MPIITLEYSPKQGCFHISDIETVCKNKTILRKTRVMFMEIIFALIFIVAFCLLAKLVEFLYDWFEK